MPWAEAGPARLGIKDVHTRPKFLPSWDTFSPSWGGTNEDWQEPEDVGGSLRLNLLSEKVS